MVTIYCHAVIIIICSTEHNCDPLWKKGYFGANIKFSPHVHIAKTSMLLVFVLFVTGENYPSLHWSGVDFLLLALVASLQSYGRRLCLHCIIEIPHTISQNDVCIRVRHI